MDYWGWLRRGTRYLCHIERSIRPLPANYCRYTTEYCSRYTRYSEYCGLILQRVHSRELPISVWSARAGARHHRAIWRAGWIKLRLCHGYLHSNVLTITQLNVRDLITERLLRVFLLSIAARFCWNAIRLGFSSVKYVRFVIHKWVRIVILLSWSLWAVILLFVKLWKFYFTMKTTYYL